MNTADLLATLHASIATAYPTAYIFGQRPGRVSVVVQPARAAWDTPVCEPWPLDLEAEVTVFAGDASEQGVMDLAHHIPDVADLIRQAGFTPLHWQPATQHDHPAIAITATALGTGG